MPGWAWFVTGLFVGGTVGVLTAGLCKVAARADEQERPGYNPLPPAEERWPKAPPAPPLGRRLMLDRYGNCYWAVGRRED